EKPLAALSILIEKQGQIVTHEAFRQRLWPGNVVVEFDRNLATAINKLRSALRDTASEPQYIETIPRVGYRFIAPVQTVYDEAAVPPQSPPSAAARRRASRWLWVGALAVAVSVLGPGLWWLSANLHRPVLLTWKDSVVVGDFANSTGDRDFDGALRQGLLSQLERSPSISAVSDSRMAQALALMAKPSGTKLTPDVAREICQRTGSAATIDGSITRLGQQFVLQLVALDCQSDDALAHETATADAKEGVLAALGDATARLRAQLGQSLPNLPSREAPPENVTTTSLQALKAYSIGYHNLLVDNESVRASPFFERAIALDQNFAMAYARLGRCYGSEDNTGKAAIYFAKAHALRSHASERERFYIDAYYEYISVGQLEAAAKVFELWAQTYPADPAPLAALGNLYTALGHYERALDARQRALKTDSSSGLNYGNLAQNLVQLGRFEQARHIGRLARARSLDSMSLRAWLRWGQFIEGKPDDREGIVGPLIDRPLAKEWVLLQDAAFAAWGGQLTKARALTQRSIAGYRNSKRMETVATREAQSAVRAALAGDVESARRWAQSALADFDSEHVRAGAAITYALVGDVKTAKRMVDAISTAAPNSTVVRGNYLPVVSAAIALRADKPKDAINALKPAFPYGVGMLGYPLLPVYLRGQAYLALGDGAKAAAEFNQLRGGPCAQDANFPCALAALELARAHAMQGGIVQARSEYTRFIAQWSHADASAPQLHNARAELDQLAIR
ncbi:MAG: winged helix-turn-helix domain-containing protein, partial [Xanthomonadales bacterium]|nr:winged helix-turn-helix domain-containing protein [Xanthomonadales bacterium]